MSTRCKPNPLDIISNDPNCIESDTTKASNELELLPKASLETAVLQCVSYGDSRESTSSSLQQVEAVCCVDSFKHQQGSTCEPGKRDLVCLHPTCGLDKIVSGTTNVSSTGKTKTKNNHRYRPRKRQCLAPAVVNDDAKCNPSRRCNRRNSFVMVFPTAEFLNEVQSSINDDC